MAAANFGTWFEFMERPDFDGQALHITPGDPGGATNHGWTYKVWHGFADLHGLDASYDHFVKMQKEDFRLPSRLAFWNAVQADRMPVGIDVFWCDFQFGSFWASSQLQPVVGAEPDNHVGDLTIEAVATAFAADPLGLMDRLLEARLAYYKTLAVYDEFGRGWDRRAAEGHKLATALIGQGPVSVAANPGSDKKEC